MTHWFNRSHALQPRHGLTSASARAIFWTDTSGWLPIDERTQSNSCSELPCLRGLPEMARTLIPISSSVGGLLIKEEGSGFFEAEVKIFVIVSFSYPLICLFYGLWRWNNDFVPWLPVGRCCYSFFVRGLKGFYKPYYLWD